MGYRLNRLNKPVFMAGPKPKQSDFDIHQRLESCNSHFLPFQRRLQKEMMSIVKNPPAGIKMEQDTLDGNNLSM